MKKILLSLIMVFSICFIGLNVKASENWDLEPISNNQLNYGFTVSPSGTNNGYLLDINVIYPENYQYQVNGFYMYLSSWFYYDFYIFSDEDLTITYYDENADLDYTFTRSRYTLKSMKNTIREFDLSNVEEDWIDVDIMNPYHFYGIPNYNDNYFYFRYPNPKNLTNFHIYLYLDNSNINNCLNYLYNNLDNSNYQAYFINNTFDYKSYFSAMMGNLEFGDFDEECILFVNHNYIFNYDTAYSSFIANGVIYYNNYLFNVDDEQGDGLKYGYGFAQSCFPLDNLYISGAIYDNDTDALYPTYSQNMLYYVIPSTFPMYQKFSNIDYSSIELLYSYDYKNFSYQDLEDTYIYSGLAKEFNSLNYSDYINSNFYSFIFNKSMLCTNNSIYSLYNNNPFQIIDAKAYYNSNINSNSIIDNITNNDDLANDLGLKYISCHWWDLKGQLNNLFYYIVTGLPFLNNIYTFLKQIFSISKIGFNLIAFSVPLLSLVAFIMLVYVVFNKMLK